MHIQTSFSKQNHKKQLFVDIYNIPLHIDERDFSYFIFKTMQKCKGLKKGTTPIFKNQLIQNLRRVRLYFRSQQQLLNCLDMNGLRYGQKYLYMVGSIRQRSLPQLKIPKDLQVKKINRIVKDSFQKLIIQNIQNCQEFEVFTLLQKYGQIISFQPVYKEQNLVYCYFQYDKKQYAQECLQKLNNFKFKQKKIIVQRSVLIKDSQNSTTRIKTVSNVFEKDPHQFYLTFDTQGFFKETRISCVLLLKNIISSFVQKQKIMNEVVRQLQKIGPITSRIFKDKNIYVQFERVEYAQICYLLLLKRKYDGKNIDVSFYDPFNYSDNILI